MTKEVVTLKDVVIAICRLRKDTLLATIVIALLGWGLMQHSKNEVQQHHLKKDILQRYEASKNILAGSIDVCFEKKHIANPNSKQRNRARVALVEVDDDNKKEIPSKAFFILTKYTRFDESISTQSLCSYNEKTLNLLRNKLTNNEFPLMNELN